MQRGHTHTQGVRGANKSQKASVWNVACINTDDQVLYQEMNYVIENVLRSKKKRCVKPAEKGRLNLWSWRRPKISVKVSNIKDYLEQMLSNTYKNLHLY